MLTWIKNVFYVIQQLLSPTGPKHSTTSTLTNARFYNGSNLSFFTYNKTNFLKYMYNGHLQFHHSQSHSNTITRSGTKRHVNVRISCCFSLWQKSKYKKHSQSSSASQSISAFNPDTGTVVCHRLHNWSINNFTLSQTTRLWWFWITMCNTP